MRVLRYIVVVLAICIIFGAGEKAFGEEISGVEPSGVEVNRAYFDDRFKLHSAVNFQEKLYIQTDCDTYNTGDTIWYRVHRVDAMYHSPKYYSGLVYVDIYDYDNKLVNHFLVAPTDSAFYCSYVVKANKAHGSYYMVAYTNWMQNFSSDLYYRRKIFINNPMNKKFTLNHEYHLESRDRLRVDFDINSYTKYDWIAKHYMLDVTLVKQNSSKDNKVITRQILDDGKVSIRFSVADSIDYVNVSFNGDKPEAFEQRFIVPFLEDDVDLQFMAEGGSLIAGLSQRVGFKAVSVDGLGAQVSGTVYNSMGETVAFFGSSHLGMGDFMLTPTEGESYHAKIIMPNGVSKSFDLPEVMSEGFTLACTPSVDAVRIATVASSGLSWGDDKWLLLHCRGRLLQALPLSRNLAFNMPMKSLPSGVTHAVVIDTMGTIYTERLLFKIEDEAPTVVVDGLKQGYTKRSKVDLGLTFVDAAGRPIQGSFAASVVDDARAMVDTTVADIRTTLLLTSDLRGNIEEPNYYYDKSEPLSRRVRSADLLMLTQGWRRFDLGSVMRDSIPEHKYSLLLGQSIYGRLKNLWKDEGREGAIVVISPTHNIVRLTTADEDGYFEVKNISFPEGARFVVQGLNEKNKKRVEVQIEEEGYKKITNPMIETRYLLREGVAETPESMKYDAFYRDLTVGYYYENGMMVYVMDAISVSTTSEPEDWVDKLYQNYSDYYITGEDLTSGAYTTLWDWFMEIPGLYVDEINNRLTMRGGSNIIVVVDEVMMSLSEVTTYLVLEDIQSVGFTSTIGNIMMYADNADGMVMVHLKDGRSINNSYQKSTASFFSISPQGYYEHTEFYNPLYETKESLNDTDPDNRITIHWQPNITPDKEGKATMEFYTADTPADYILRIEGVSTAGEPLSFSTRIRNE